MLDIIIAGISDQVNKNVRDDERISQYYESDDFAQIKETSNSLKISRKKKNILKKKHSLFPSFSAQEL